jgi:hypothetical protein
MSLARMEMNPVIKKPFGRREFNGLFLAIF